ncbi:MULTISPECIES: conjugal transfer protein TrbF [Hyphomonas]|uniref:Conjugal transfer protein TrbF n=1 Tax=Hyphomonas adhaerens TaxID=81029 RepID=A0A3B9GWA9_9PROT|nr:MULTISPECIES: conjugal transfer protein TrbF [Hyphomonas]MBB39106.1 conjugal transfer protein TrbF [Hyphomonas sp.]HAE26658.1 conjugal transfer protein TrbF [Hyphomonas adhaerens]|tara:strand:- start:2593 stop:3276 length:684 start_codon:yes stop_codon:yes gene_type:complete
MRWKRNTSRYGETTAPVTPYQRAAQAWDDRIGSARVQAANWRLAALGSLALSFVLAGGLAWRSTQAIVTPYVVELTGEGAVRAVGPADGHYEPTDAQVAYHLAAFVRNTRSISIDPVVVRENWLAAYAYATDRAAATLNDYARDNDPFAEVGRRSVSVDVLSVVRASDDSFTVRWRETAFRNGAETGQSTYTGIFSVVIDPPRTEEALRANPLGLYVHGLNWSKDHQ